MKTFKFRAQFIHVKTIKYAYFYRLNVPGPGAYDLRSSGKMVSESAPSYTFGTRAKGRKSDNAPAPNNYSLPQIISQKHVTRKSAPQFSMVGRSKVGGFDEDLKKVQCADMYEVLLRSKIRYNILAWSHAQLIETNPVSHALEKVGQLWRRLELC